MPPPTQLSHPIPPHRPPPLTTFTLPPSTPTQEKGIKYDVWTYLLFQYTTLFTFITLCQSFTYASCISRPHHEIRTVSLPACLHPTHPSFPWPL